MYVIRKRSLTLRFELQSNSLAIQTNANVDLMFFHATLFHRFTSQHDFLLPSSKYYGRTFHSFFSIMLILEKEDKFKKINLLIMYIKPWITTNPEKKHTLEMFILEGTLARVLNIRPLSNLI